MGYTHPDAVVTAPSGVKIDPYDPAFSARTDDPQDESLPAVYLFSNTRSGDGPAYSMAEDGTVLGEHWCSHRGYMRHDLHDRPDRLAAIQAHYPGGCRLVVLMGEGEMPPPEVMERNRLQAVHARRAMTVTASEHERKPRCYIAGPIVGVPDFLERFAAAVPAVEALGYEACHMRADLRALIGCDAIFMLPGWRESRGATAEHAVAVACGIPVLEEKEGNPNEHHR